LHPLKSSAFSRRTISTVKREIKHERKIKGPTQANNGLEWATRRELFRRHSAYRGGLERRS
jgi:hypothetical protein